MFNSGVRGKRAPDNFGTVTSQTQFVQQQSPQPSITGWSISGSDDTALDTAGGQTVLVNGTGFASGAAVTVNGQTISPVTVVSPTQLSFTSIALAGGSYSLIVYNSTGGAAILVPGLIYSAVPTWTTSAGSIGTTYETTPISTSVVATSDSAITYSLSSGSLPSGATLYANGVITGTSPVESGSTTYTFAIKAEDAELQDTTRTFTLTINTDVVTWSSPADNTTYTANINEVASNVVLSATSAAGYEITYIANTLPTGLSLAGNTISGTPTVVANSSTLLTATASTTNRSATRTINWIIQLGSDPYFYLTTLLLNGETSSNYWIQDASTNKFALTVNADTRPAAFSPYETVWSNYFDGTGDFLSFPNNLRTAMGGGFAGNLSTMEAWVYTSTDGTIFGRYDAVAENGRFYWAVSSNNLTFLWTTSAGSATSVSSTGSLVRSNQWNHVAMTIDATTASSSTIKMFINGVLANTFTSQDLSSQTAFAPSNPPAIGIATAASSAFLGYISNFRFVTGSLVYTTSFFPPSSPLTAISGTSLLTCQSNRLIDNSTNNFTITRNGDVTVSNFGPFTETDLTTGSGYFDGNGDRLTLAATNQFAAGTQDFCFECWYYPVSKVDNFPRIAQSGLADWATSDNWALLDRHNDASTKFSWACFNLGGNAMLLSSTTVAQNNVWYHIAVTRSGSTFRMFINGTQEATYTNSGAVTTSSTVGFYIGGQGAGDSDINGYVSDARYIVGSSVYTSNFTPPTSPLTAISGTGLLTLQNRFGENNNRFVDTSGMNSIVTKFANATQGTFTPFSQTGWSGYFDGTGDYLTIPASIAFQFDTGDYTIEAWLYSSTTSWSVYATGGSGAIDQFVCDAGTLYWFYTIFGGGVANYYTSADLNVWTHVAVSRSSGTNRIFKNGIVMATASSSTAIGSNNTLQIGRRSDGIYHLTGYISNLRVLKGTGLYTGAFTPPTSPLTAIANTSLLTCADNRFIDDSANNFTITRNGDTSIQAFSPFTPRIITPTSYSGYFDGTGDFIDAGNNSAFAFGTGDFTVECWIFATAASDSPIYEGRANGSTSDGFTLTAFSSSVIRIFSGSALISSSGTSYLNQWTHIAACRISSVTTLYINGVSIGTSVSLGNNTTGSAVIGGGRYGGGTTVSASFTGYISNFRIVKGTSVYTSGFTPPTSPLTAIANTSVLTCQSNRFIDNSTNNFTLTVNGNSIPTQFNPFGNTSLTGDNAAYSVANVGGSMYFDGNGDYLAVANNSDAFNCGTSNFTIEFWYYDDGNSLLYPNIISSTDWNTGTGGVGIRYNNTGQANKFSFFWFGVGDPWLTTPGTFPGKVWNHVAVVRSGNTFTLYVNGVSQASNTNSGTINWGLTSGGPKIGGGNWDGSNSWTKGWISNLRLIKGVALYTSAFVPSATPLTAISNTTLLLNGTNSGLIDYTSKNNLETVGNAQLTTAVTKFGNASISFDGTGDYLVLPPSPNFAFRTGPFTIEGWVRINANGDRGIFQQGTSSFPAGTGNSVALGYNNSGTWQIYAKNTNTNSSATYSTNTWHHFALVRSSTTTTLYIDGTSVITVTGDTTDYTGTYFGVGSIYGTSGTNLNGYIDDLRVTTGFARYTANFTPPTSAFITF